MKNNGMTLIVKTVTRITVWMIILYGAYIILHGHLTPGGGFGGGVIIALALLNVMLAYGREFTTRWLNISVLEHGESLSALLFLITGIVGLLVSGAFLANFISKGQLFHLLSAGTLPVLNIIIGFKVALSLFLVVWVLTSIKLSKGDTT
ncbi:MAG: MnhB domain-containing protein [candidate division KSB1 bacterium]|nr:MnhB domain-containing protein [candidate division KSB1 bacterium]